jgi:hypothetical protein
MISNQYCRRTLLIKPKNSGLTFEYETALFTPVSHSVKPMYLCHTLNWATLLEQTEELIHATY